MKILVAIDSIKNYENSIEIGNIFKEELGSNADIIPFLDGGEGTVEAMQAFLNGDYHYVNVHNPKNDVITARYVMRENYAVMEMAQSSGLRLLYKEELDVMNSSSLGFGEMLVDGLNAGAKSFYIGIGDTATNDLGMGMLYSLGARFFDDEGNELNPIAKNMVNVETIDISNMDHRIFDADITIATSTDMTLFGENSFLESRVYRKGASIEDIAFLYKGSKNFKGKIEQTLGINPLDLPTLGSGGGVAWALYTFFKTKISKSMDVILEKIDFDTMIKNYDLLILGENVDQFDGLSSINVANVAKSYKENLKIIFLEDKDGKKIEQREKFDFIYEYHISDNFDRDQMKDAIRALAKDLSQNYFSR
ncbi:glycerate kinase [Anaerococcus sp. mt242]|uniref:glycerate kinase n=1 Tax=Anaerococcus sp. mt242 TaxID=2661917 RepID=UPI0019318C8D|nr:glycerate kinase [Anaerococcus sp. mt242]MBM0046705.1 glycerate kinase [Anaerococcus sp. mt242]